MAFCSGEMYNLAFVTQCGLGAIRRGMGWELVRNAGSGILFLIHCFTDFPQEILSTLAFEWHLFGSFPILDTDREVQPGVRVRQKDRKVHNGQEGVETDRTKCHRSST
jgi:hypothetical protein